MWLCFVIIGSTTSQFNLTITIRSQHGLHNGLYHHIWLIQTTRQRMIGYGENIASLTADVYYAKLIIALNT